MKHKLGTWLRTPLGIVFSVVLAASTMMPLLIAQVAEAYGLVTSRSVTISSASDAATNATTTYSVSFDAATSGNIEGMVVDFCSNDPIIGDTTCTAPTNFSLASSTLGTVTTTGQTGLTWSKGSSTTSTLILSSTGTVSGSVASGANVNFSVTDVQNPTTLGTFYARIYTYATSAGATGYTAATPGSFVDAGGIALSTANEISVTAKVQETLTFCVGTTALPASGTSATPVTSCSSLTGSNVALGNNNGVLSSTGPYVDVSTQYLVGTNANHAAAVVLKGSTLTFGSDTITALTSPTASSPGTSQFGLCTYSGTGSNLVFTNEVNTAYNNAGCTAADLTQTAGYASTGGISGSTAPEFALNTAYTTTASGDPFAQENAGTNSTGIIAMLGNISSSQIAGIYTTTLSFIATGTY